MSDSIWCGDSFSGTKVALICGDRVVAYQRDNKASIPFPGYWDLPGGGREGEESPIQCGLREIEEEFGLRLSEARVDRLTRYPSLREGGIDTYFCLARITSEEVAAVVFGSEGQHWALMSLSEFLDHPGAVKHLQSRLRLCITEGG